MFYLRLLLTFSLVFFVSVVSFAAENVVIAEIDGVPITNFELSRQIDKVLPFRVNYHGKISDEKKEQIETEAMENLIERAYKIRFAISSNVKISDSEIDNRIIKAKTKFKTEEEFVKAVGEETVKGLKESIQRSMLALKVEKEFIDSKVNVSDKEVKNFYDNNKQMYLKPQQFRASDILIKVDPASTKDVRDELRKKAESLMVQAKAGDNFYNLAYYNSEDKTKFVGGDIGLFHEGQAEKPLEDALKKLEVGGISDVVESLHGFHILKLTELHPPRQLTLDEVSQKIKSMLEKKQRDTLYQEWMENLKATYKIERFDS